MSIKFVPQGSSVKNVKTIRFGNSGRVGKVVCTDGTHVITPYILQYNIVDNFVGGTIGGPQSLKFGETKTLTIVPETGRLLPANADDITITGVEESYWSYNSSTGKITLSHPTAGVSNILVDGTCPEILYNIDIDITHGELKQAPQHIGALGGATITFSPYIDYNYGLPRTIAIYGDVSYTYTKNYSDQIGTIKLSNAKSDVHIVIECPAVEQLAPPPSISLSSGSNILKIKDNDGRATGFDIYSGNIRVGHVDKY